MSNTQNPQPRHDDAHNKLAQIPPRPTGLTTREDPRTYDIESWLIKLVTPAHTRANTQSQPPRSAPRTIEQMHQEHTVKWGTPAALQAVANPSPSELSALRDARVRIEEQIEEVLRRNPLYYDSSDEHNYIRQLDKKIKCLSAYFDQLLEKAKIVQGELETLREKNNELVKDNSDLRQFIDELEKQCAMLEKRFDKLELEHIKLESHYRKARGTRGDFSQKELRRPLSEGDFREWRKPFTFGAYC